MSGVIATFKVMPTGIDVNLDLLEAKVRETVGADQVKREPIAFGLVALIVAKVIPDEAGFIDKMEELLRGIEGVGEVETVEVTKAL
ncbi:MAG: elongation factor 1-beta [Candidatus Aenigmarchaeota archaeon]|nr:elongation factor 1-beta [Candidatus Aenigmarchaeota archaeon]